MFEKLRHRGTLTCTLIALCGLLWGCSPGGKPGSSHASLSPDDQAYVAALADGLTQLAELKVGGKTLLVPEDKDAVVLVASLSFGPRAHVQHVTLVRDFIAVTDACVVSCVCEGEGNGAGSMVTVLVSEFELRYASPGFTLDRFLAALKKEGLTVGPLLRHKDGTVKAKLAMQTGGESSKPMTAIGEGVRPATGGP